MQIETTGSAQLHCDLCRSKTPKFTNLLAALLWADTNGWDWYTGRKTKTSHFCTNCKSGRMTPLG